MRKKLKVLGIVILALILLRGVIFRNTLIYHNIGTRDLVSISNPYLISEIESRASDKDLDVAEIIHIANDITTSKLSFTKNSISSNPNISFDTHQANCIGYSSMFNSIVNHLIIQHKLETKIEASHKIGRLDFLGIDLHRFLQDPFFKDHDFNIIRNLETGEVISIDPTLSDYLKIKTITSNVNL